MAVISREDLKRAKELVRTEAIPAPEFGEGMEIVVKGRTIADKAAIISACNTPLPDGGSLYDAKQDHIQSLLTAIAEPRVTLDDVEFLEELPEGLATRIMMKSAELSGSLQSQYDQMVEFFECNKPARQFFVVCVEKLGRFPSELKNVSEMEFYQYLAALQADVEEEEKKTPDND
jgi:hypothetical protein